MCSIAPSSPELTTSSLHSWDNYIASVQLAFPEKAATLDYLDGSGAAPPRFARVSVDVQATENPYIEHYLVGPLPLSNTSTAVPYTAVSTSGSSRIRMFSSDFDATLAFAQQQAETGSDIIQDILGKPYTDYGELSPLL